MFRFCSFRLACGFFAATVTLGAGRGANAQTSQPPSLSELFQKGKTEFKIASYRSSLATLDQLDQLSQQPGHEKDRAELVLVIAFYRGANLAALGQAEAAKKEFEKYLASSPNTRLDASLYPKPVIAVFNRARDELAGSRSGRGRASDDKSLAAEYARFRLTGDTPAITIDEKWATRPVRYLMTEAEKTAWDHITDPVEHAAFVTAFWQRRDPNPGTSENEFRIEFERRAAFADKRFRSGEKEGTQTDQGVVFVVLGPPTYSRLLPMVPQDDLNLNTRIASRREAVLNPDGSIAMRRVPPPGLGAEPGGGQREVWYYKRDRLPASVHYAEVAFEFISKQSYGVAVLQREPVVLKTLEQAGRQSIASGN